MSASILVVDDLFRQRFRREVRQGDYVMHFAVSGEQALERLAGEIQPTFVASVSDINMPGMDGLTLLDEVKKRFPDLPLMMVTAYGDDDRFGPTGLGRTMETTAPADRRATSQDKRASPDRPR